MLVGFMPNETGIQEVKLNEANKHQLDLAIWIDLVNPSEQEEKIIEEYFHIEVPTKKEMQEIELSSRLYSEDNAIFMTASMVAQSDSPEPKVDAVTFILSKNKLITLRYITPQSFNLYIAQLKRFPKQEYNGESILLGLLEITTDRLADILEKVSYKFDQISHVIFHKNNNSSSTNVINYKQLLQTIGTNCVLGTKTRDSLISFMRLVSFFGQKAKLILPTELEARLTIIRNDLSALSDYAVYISTEVNFLLDATLGMINIEQNNIIKIFSVAAVIFLPPTLIASLYGMNFKHMPELQWHFGYPIALLLMGISAWLPYRFFKKKKWL